MKNKKIYFVYKFTDNPNPNETYRRLEKLFGKGYIFGREHPEADNGMTREKMRELFTKDMKEGNFDLVIVDTSYGKGRFMEEEIALAKGLKIPVMEVNLLEAEVPRKGEIKLKRKERGNENSF
jgi:hypothetical protein